MIPLSSLPKDLRQVVEAWNALHIKTFTGLTVYMRNKLQQLLRQYTPEDVLRAIGYIARSPFLLGQTEASKNWRITLGWVLKPENCAKLLSGQYEQKWAHMIASCLVSMTPPFLLYLLAQKYFLQGISVQAGVKG